MKVVFERRNLRSVSTLGRSALSPTERMRREDSPLQLVALQSLEQRISSPPLREIRKSTHELFLLVFSNRLIHLSVDRGVYGSVEEYSQLGFFEESVGKFEKTHFGIFNEIRRVIDLYSTKSSEHLLSRMLRYDPMTYISERFNQFPLLVSSHFFPFSSSSFRNSFQQI